MALDLQ